MDAIHATHTPALKGEYNQGISIHIAVSSFIRSSTIERHVDRTGKTIASHGLGSGLAVSPSRDPLTYTSARNPGL